MVELASSGQAVGTQNQPDQLVPGAHHQTQPSSQFYQSAGSQKNQAVVVATIGGGSGGVNHQRKLANANMNQLNQQQMQNLRNLIQHQQKKESVPNLGSQAAPQPGPTNPSGSFAQGAQARLHNQRTLSQF